MRWRDRAMAGESSARWLVGLALLAALAEVATMLPYLGALGCWPPPACRWPG